MLWLRGLRATAAQRPPREPPIWNMFSPYEQWKHFNIERDRETLGGTNDHDIELLLCSVGKAVVSHCDAIFSPCQDILKVIEGSRS